MFQNGHGTTIPSQSHVMGPTIKKSYSFQLFPLICRRCNLFCQWARFRLEELTIWMGLAWPVQNPWLGEPWPGPLRHVWPMVNIIVLLVFNGFHHCYVILKIKGTYTWYISNYIHPNPIQLPIVVETNTFDLDHTNRTLLYVIQRVLIIFNVDNILAVIIVDVGLWAIWFGPT